MAKKGKKPEAEIPERKPEENNWEIEENAEMTMKCIPDELMGVLETDGDLNVTQEIVKAWERVDPEIRNGNPVWKLGIKQQEFIFVFRDGRKVRVRNAEI